MDEIKVDELFHEARTFSTDIIALWIFNIQLTQR